MSDFQTADHNLILDVINNVVVTVHNIQGPDLKSFSLPYFWCTRTVQVLAIIKCIYQYIFSIF
jgi:hypothetical protein